MPNTTVFSKPVSIVISLVIITLLITWYIVAGQATQYAGQPVSNTWPIIFVGISVILVITGLLLKRVASGDKERSINA